MMRWFGSSEMKCRQVGKVLQAYLDGQTDDVTARRVRRHLEACRRCGLEAATFAEIAGALARQEAKLDSLAVGRLREFGDRLAAGEIGRQEPG